MPTQMKNANAIGHAVMGEHREHRQRHHEKQRDGAQQLRAVEVVSQPAIQRHDDHQHQRHDRHRVGARLGRKLGEHEGLAQRLHHLVGREQQEPMQEEQERGAALAGRHARDVRQQPLEAGQAGVVVGPSGQRPPRCTLAIVNMPIGRCQQIRNRPSSELRNSRQLPQPGSIT